MYLQVLKGFFDIITSVEDKKEKASLAKKLIDDFCWPFVFTESLRYINNEKARCKTMPSDDFEPCKYFTSKLPLICWFTSI